LVLLDEPFSSLDKDLREELRRETKYLFKKTNTSSIVVTHEMEEAEDICDKIIKLEQGKILNLTF
jgi:iron(III) transport system ATP-binding protein